MDKHQLKVLVTGSSGLLGGEICKSLADRGCNVFALDQLQPPDSMKQHPRIHPIKCDLTDEESVYQAIRQVGETVEGRLDSVVHLAAYYDFSGEDSPLYEKITVEGTDRLLRGLNDLAVDQFVFSSTMLVHRPCQVGQHIDEDDPLLAKWPYPQSKIDTERLICEKHPDTPSVFLRIAGVYTDWGKQPTLVQQIKRIYEKDFQSYFYPADPKVGQSAVYLDDTVDAVVKCVERRGLIEPQTAILVGEADPPAYGDLQDEVGKLLHDKEWATLYVPPIVAKAGATATDMLSGGDAFIKPFMVEMAGDHYALDISRAQELLGWKPNHQLLDHLPVIIGKLQSDPKQWYRKNGVEE